MFKSIIQATCIVFILLLTLVPTSSFGSEFSSNEIDSNFFTQENDFLDVNEAFVLDNDILDDKFIIRWNIADGYYLYQHRLSFSANGAELDEPQIPAGLKKVDEYFGEVEVYYQHLEVVVPFHSADQKVELTVNYQGCADAGLCYTPTSRTLIFEQKNGSLEFISGNKTIVEGFPVPVTTDKQPLEPKQDFSDDTQTLSSILEEGDLLWTLMAFLGAGLLLTFTPCVLPMIPILSGIIAGQGKEITTAKAFRLSFVYVQAMAITYALLGVLVARAGSSLSGYLQSPWILGFVAGIFVLLGFSMFGFFQFQLPDSIQQRIQKISAKQKGGNYLGVALMGIISTLIVSPCTSAPLTAALLFIAKSGNQWMGGLSLYFLGLGMGIPLLIIGISEGKLLPGAGAWMDKVKMLFGFIMLGMALYITDHIIPGPVYLLLWACLLIVTAIFFGAFSPAVSNSQLLQKSSAIFVFLIGILYLVGAGLGNDRLLHPLEGLKFESSSNQQHKSALSKLKFQPVASLSELETYLQQAKLNGQPVMFDFFAEWCVACYEFEDYTFSDPKVGKLLTTKNVLLLQADVTSNNSKDLELMKHFNILGLPSILFFDAKGNEMINMRATGFEKAEAFLSRLNHVFY